VLRDALRRTLTLPQLDVGLADLGALALVAGILGGCTLLGLLVAWWAGLGLFFALLVLWGGAAVAPTRT